MFSPNIIMNSGWITCHFSNKNNEQSVIHYFFLLLDTEPMLANPVAFIFEVFKRLILKLLHVMGRHLPLKKNEVHIAPGWETIFAEIAAPNPQERCVVRLMYKHLNFERFHSSSYQWFSCRSLDMLYGHPSY